MHECTIYNLHKNTCSGAGAVGRWIFVHKHNDAFVVNTRGERIWKNKMYI